VAGLVLFGSPTFVEYSAAQCADVPLGCLIAMTLILLALADRGVSRSMRLVTLAGATAGLAAWTKNEGLVFVAALLVGRVATSAGWGAKGEVGREMRALLLGLVPVLVVVGLFKLRFAHGNFLLSSIDTGEALEQVVDLSYLALGSRLFAGGVAAFESGWPVLLLLLALVKGMGAPNDAKNVAWIGSFTLAALGSAYFGIFILSPYGFDWYLDTTLDRLLLHLWPAAVFIFFLAVGDLQSEGWIARALRRRSATEVSVG
jgi:hypothetical protein